MTRVRHVLRDWAPALCLFVLVIAAWEIAVRVLDIQQFLLPKPSVIAQTLWDDRSELFRAGWNTFQEAFWGFVVGSALAISLALVLARFRALGAALIPYAIAANAVPIIAFAPIANNWFGIEKGSKIAIAAVLCFFPVFINTLRGLTSVRPAAVELMRSYAAGTTDVFCRLRIPTSLPFLFSALKVASVLAMIGAIVGEFFGGSQNQLGIVINNAAALFQFDVAWAAIVVACLFGVGFYLAVSLVEHATMRRLPSARGGGA